MSKNDKYPNGFTSWLETFYHIHSDVMSEEYYNNNKSDIVEKTRDDHGSIAIVELFEKLATKFEKIHEGEKWEDKEFYEEITKFVKEELYPAPEMWFRYVYFEGDTKVDSVISNTSIKNDNTDFEIMYSLQEIVNELEELTVGKTMAFKPNRDDEKALGIIQRTK